MRTLRQDVLYALRQMRLSPVFTLTAMLTLALGIGATTAIFSLIDSVMLKSLPVADPAQLYRVGSGMNCCGQIGPQKEWGIFPYTLYQRIAAAAPEFEQTAAFEAWHSEFSVRRASGNEPAKPLRSEYVSGNYFATLGLKAYAGRILSQSDDQPAAAPAAMLSQRVWQQEYGSDPKVVGSTFVLDGHPFTIVGVTPPGFFGETLRSDPPELFIPLQQEPLLAGQNTVLKAPLAWLRIIGRLRLGAKTDGMAARFTTITRAWLLSDLGAQYPQYLDQLKATLPTETVSVIPAGGGIAEMKAGYESSLRILMVVCGLVLLIACANLANLLLARGAARGTQAAVRLAMGASKMRLVRQSLTESVVLAVLGGAAGVVLAFAGVKLMVRRKNQSGYGPARRRAQHTRRQGITSESARGRASDFVGSFVDGRGLVDAQPDQDGASELRVRDRTPREPASECAILHLLAGKAGCDLSRSAGAAGGHSRCPRRGAGHVYAIHQQLVRHDCTPGTSHHRCQCR